MDMECGYYYFPDSETGDLYAMNLNTGEILDAVTMVVPAGSYVKTPEDQEADRKRNEGLIRRLEQDDRRRQLNKELEELGKYFFVSNEDFSSLSDAAVARLVFLATYLPLDSKQLYKTERTPLIVKDLPDLMKLSRTTVREFLKEASAYIQADKDGFLYMIADTFMRGTLPKERYTTMQRLYRNSIRNLFRRTSANKHHLLGVIFRMMPYINREYNVLCRNPGEDCFDDLDFLTLKDFCSLSNRDYQKMYRLKSEFKNLIFDVNENSERFLNIVEVGNGETKVLIIVNPHILYNGSDYKRVETLGRF